MKKHGPKASCLIAAKKHLDEAIALADLAEQSPGTVKPNVQEALEAITASIYFYGSTSPQDDHLRALWKALAALDPRLDKIAEERGYDDRETHKLLYEAIHGTDEDS